MPLTILTDADVRALLLSFTKDDILELQQSLADALHYYSTSTEEDFNGCCSTLQPLQTALKGRNGRTTLFMPASSNDGLGVKIVTLADTNTERPKPDGIDGIDGIDSSAASLDSLSLSSSPSTPLTPSTSSTAHTSSPPPSNRVSPQPTTSKGSLTLLDRHGHTRALLSASEITAFRTALASTMLFKKRHNVHDVVVFGAGKQAYWHIRLALLLRGPEIHHLSIINRSFPRAEALIESLYKPTTTTSSYPAPSTLHFPKFQILTPKHTEYARLLKSTIRASAVIFCTTPSTTPLFPPGHVTNTEGRKKGRYIAAIGSNKPWMLELDPEILRQAVEPEHTHHHHHKHARRGGAVVVDSVDACLREAGEVVQAGLSGKQVVEIGELIMLRRDAEARRKELNGFDGDGEGLDAGGVELGEAREGKKKTGFLGIGRRKEGEKEKAKEKAKEKDKDKGTDRADRALVEWLQKGNVVYKSVGLGLMDVVVGGELVRLADERGIGVRVEGF